MGGGGGCKTSAKGGRRGWFRGGGDRERDSYGEIERERKREIEPETVRVGERETRDGYNSLPFEIHGPEGLRCNCPMCVVQGHRDVSPEGSLRTMLQLRVRPTSDEI